MSKQRDTAWVILTAAALDARDALRTRFVAGLDRLARYVTEPEAAALIGELRRLAGEHSDRLRVAIKGRGGAE